MLAVPPKHEKQPKRRGDRRTRHTLDRDRAELEDQRRDYGGAA